MNELNDVDTIETLLREANVVLTPEIEHLIGLVVSACCDVVIESDTSSKMILNSPYREIVDNIMTHFGYRD